MKAKKTLKCLMAMVAMVMAFAVTGIVAEAEEPAYTPTVISEVKSGVNLPAPAVREVIVPARSTVLIPFNVPQKGGLWLYYWGQNDLSVPGAERPDEYEDLYFGLYSDAACSDSGRLLYRMAGEETKSEDDVTILTPGTYYLAVENTAYTPLSYQFGAYFFSAADKTVSSGKVYAEYSTDYNQKIYHKFKAPKTGYLKVSAAEVNGYSVYVQLLSSKKKALSDELYAYSSNGHTVGFGVEKGKTYYIATRTSGSSTYSVGFKFASVSEKSGSKQSKAVTLKKNKTVKGVQPANGKTSGADWYKIKLTKKQKFKIYVSGVTTGSYDIKCLVIPANKRVIMYNDTFKIPENGKGVISTDGKWSAGTYYLKVYKYNKKASGYYTLKWK